MAPSTFPPYLTSGASSRAHHALLARLNYAVSPQEEDKLIEDEVERCRVVLSGPNVPTAKVAESLIILLHCSLTRHTATAPLEWALLSALQLAEGGHNVRERRVGYMYLCERLPRDHELGLMLINTIRKDLASAKPSGVLMALHAIAKLPIPELGPAVDPLLTSKALLKYKLPAVRQRTLQALLSIHRQNAYFPVPISRLVKMLESEADGEVTAIILRVMKEVLQTGAHTVHTVEERTFLVQQIIEADEGGRRKGAQLSLDVLRTLQAVVSQSSEPVILRMIGDYISERLNNLDGHVVRRWQAAFLLETCAVSRYIPLPVTVHAQCINLISTILLPDTATASSSTHQSPAANDHILAIRCLHALPRDVWDGKLGEAEMQTIMQGIESPDDSGRRATLRLLRDVSPELLDLTFNGLCSSLRDSSGLFLPLGVSPDSTPEMRLRLGRIETARRALDVLEVSHCGRNDDEASAGTAFGVGFSRIAEALRAEEAGKDVWEDGVRRVLVCVKSESTSWQSSFTSELLSPVASSTMSIVRATCLCDYGPKIQEDSLRALEILESDLRLGEASVQELSLVAAFCVAVRLPDEHRRQALNKLLDILGNVRKDMKKYLQKRCDKVERIIREDLADQVISTSSSRSLVDMLDALNTFEIPKASQATSPEPEARSRSSRHSRASPGTLRYDAYEPPKRHPARISSNVRVPPAGRVMETAAQGRQNSEVLPSAGDLALLDAEGVQPADASHRSDGLGLSLSQMTIRRDGASRLGDSTESVDETSQML